MKLLFWRNKKKKERKPTCKIICAGCGYIRLTYEAPSGGVTAPFNSASFCPKCGTPGGHVDLFYNGEEIKQFIGLELIKVIKLNIEAQKEMKGYYQKNVVIN